MATPETLDRPDEEVSRLPGYREYETRRAIRGLIEEYGVMKATFMVSLFLEDEKAKVQR